MHIYIYIIKYIYIFSSHLHPSGTSKNPFSRSALEEAKSAQISEVLREDCPSRSRRCGPPPTVILQCGSRYPRKAIKSGRLGYIMSPPYQFAPALPPYYIPGILCWEILWVCNSPWAIGHVSRQVKNWRSSLQPLEMFPLSLKQYTSNTLFNTPTRDLAVALAGICIEVCDV